MLHTLKVQEEITVDNSKFDILEKILGSIFEPIKLFETLKNNEIINWFDFRCLSGCTLFEKRCSCSKHPDKVCPFDEDIEDDVFRVKWMIGARYFDDYYIGVSLNQPNKFIVIPCTSDGWIKYSRCSIICSFNTIDEALKMFH